MKAHLEAIPGSFSLNNHGSAGFTLMREKEMRSEETKAERTQDFA